MKVKQIAYQIFYRIKKIKPLSAYKIDNKGSIAQLSFSDFLSNNSYTDGAGTFTFLNKKATFGATIDWNFMEYGKLWNYNLHYANFILQENVDLKKRIDWLESLHAQLNENANGLEPYPVSIRLINTIRLINRHSLNNPLLIENVRAEANFLSKRLEYHLLANHLLENAFALMLGGAFFNEESWIKKAQKLLREQLDEQILPDGGHFELSPMYHQIILFRVLELIDWYAKWEAHDVGELHYYIGTAKKMLSWLKQITFENGDIPLFSDSANNIIYTSKELTEYAKFLKIDNAPVVQLSASGYRKFVAKVYECVVDVGDIAVSYQPAHGHSDALSFILYANGKPFLVEQGTSTYQVGERRLLERSTKAHNTLVYKQLNQSQVWGGFRVGSRATVKIEKEDEHRLLASHNGYMKYGGLHKRTFDFLENKIAIKDEFLTNAEVEPNDCVVYFHFHPEVKVNIKEDRAIVGGTTIEFVNYTSLALETYKFASQYNQYQNASVLKVGMKSSLQTHIYF